MRPDERTRKFIPTAEKISLPARFSPRPAFGRAWSDARKTASENVPPLPVIVIAPSIDLSLYHGVTSGEASGLIAPRFLATDLAQALMARQGKQSGTRQMVGLLKLGQQYGRGKLQKSVEAALEVGCSDAAAVEHLLHQDELRRGGCEAVEVAALERYARPLPVMTEYDQLLTLGGAR